MIYTNDIEGDINQGDIIYPVKIKTLLGWWKDDEDYPVII